MAKPWAGDSASSARTAHSPAVRSSLERGMPRQPSPRSVGEREHHVGRLDERRDRRALGQPQVSHGLDGDRSHEAKPVGVELDVRDGLPGGDGDHLGGELVARTDLHGCLSRSVEGNLPGTTRGAAATLSGLTMDEPSHPTEFPVGESFARTLTEATQSLVCVLDREGRILLFNEACERATGFRRHELIGRDARDFVIPPEEREAFGEFLEYVWTTGTPAPQVGHWLSKDGGRRLIAWSNKPMAGTDGMPESLVTTGIDLTDREAREDDDALEGDPGAKLAQVSRLATEQRALRRVATLVASEVSPERVFMAVSEECARVLHVNASIVVRYEGDQTATIVGRHNRDSIDVFRVGERLPPEAHSAVARVLKTGAPARVDDWGGLTGEMATAIFRVGYRST